MYPFTTLTDSVITLRAYEFGDERALHQAIQESLPELSPWMSWASKDYTVEVASSFITVTRAHWSSGASYNFAIVDARSGRRHLLLLDDGVELSPQSVPLLTTPNRPPREEE